jgi:hypothetical protein
MIITQRPPSVKRAGQSFHGISGDDSFGFWDYHEHEPVGISIPSRMIGKMGFDEYTGCENRSRRWLPRPVMLNWAGYSLREPVTELVEVTGLMGVSGGSIRS